MEEKKTKVQVVNEYKSELDGNPSVYVGTYKKYNDGSLYGAWLDLTKFEDADEFFKVCQILHNDEADPEFMFQDFEGFPMFLYGECMNHDDIQRIIDLFDTYDKEKLDIIFEFWEEAEEGVDPETIIDRLAYSGDFDDFAMEQADMMLDQYNVPDKVRRHFDYKSYRDDMQYYYTITSNYVFND